MVSAINKKANSTPCTGLRGLIIGCGLLFAPLALAQSAAIDQELRSLQEVRVLLTDDLAQFEKTLDILLPEGTRPADSSNPAVKNLAAERKRIRERLIVITEREFALVQQRMAMATVDPNSEREAETRPVRPPAEDDFRDGDEDDVARLLALLNQYHADLEESRRNQPTAEELARREAARQDAASLAKIPFSADKVRLNGAQGITLLARITQRLSDDSIPESRRDIAPICGVKTRLYGALIASESRSLQPVGKYQYVARIRLQPGDTTLRIQTHEWELQLPQNISASDYLLTLFLPKSGAPELHIFSVDDLLAEESPYLPAWLPDKLNIKPRPG